VGIYAKVGDFKRSLEFVNQIHANNIHPNINLYNTMLTYANEPDGFFQPDQILGEIKKHQLEPDSNTFKKLVKLQIVSKLCDANGALSISQENLSLEVVANQVLYKMTSQGKFSHVSDLGLV
jgi:hypothetical protein